MSLRSRCRLVAVAAILLVASCGSSSRTESIGAGSAATSDTTTSGSTGSTAASGDVDQVELDGHLFAIPRVDGLVRDAYRGETQHYSAHQPKGTPSDEEVPAYVSYSDGIGGGRLLSVSLITASTDAWASEPGAEQIEREGITLFLDRSEPQYLLVVRRFDDTRTLQTSARGLDDGQVIAVAAGITEL